MKTDKPILSIDYGEKRFGLAISDSKGIIASPLEVLKITKRRNQESIIEEILIFVEQYKVKSILVGKPQILKKEHIKSAEKIDNFVKKLSLKTTLPIILQDETYSTTQSQNMLISLGQSTKSTKGKIDMISATVFLQEFLNSENQKNEKHN